MYLAFLAAVYFWSQLKRSDDIFGQPLRMDAGASSQEFTGSGCTQADLVKDGGHHYFISSLDVNEPGMSPDSRAQAAFVLAVICDSHKRGRLVCAEQGLLQKLLSLLSSMVRGAPSTTNDLHVLLSGGTFS